jgi:putative addiction module killer protein
MVTYVLPSGMVTVLEYLDREGSSPFAKWFGGLDATAAAKVTTAVRRMELGNSSNVEGVGAGVFENRIDFGPELPRVFWQGWRNPRHLARRRDQETAGS